MLTLSSEEAVKQYIDDSYAGQLMTEKQSKSRATRTEQVSSVEQSLVEVTRPQTVSLSTGPKLLLHISHLVQMPFSRSHCKHQEFKL